MDVYILYAARVGGDEWRWGCKGSHRLPKGLSHHSFAENEDGESFQPIKWKRKEVEIACKEVIHKYYTFCSTYVHEPLGGGFTSRMQ